MLSLFGAISDDARVVGDGTTITGGGVTAGIDFALTVIAELAGQSVAETIQLGLEHASEPPFAAGRPDIAPASVRDAVTARTIAAMPPRGAAIERATAALARL